MTISIFIPTYNNVEFLPKAIDCALSQTLKPLEVIVADDGSTDNTRDVVAGYGDAVRYIYFEHSGVYTVRNAMLGKVSGDWFFNLDADNWIEPDFLEQAARIMAESGDDKLAFVYPDRITFGDYTRKTIVPDFDVERFKLGNFVDMNSLIHTETAKRFGFDPAFNDGWGDYDFFLTLAKNGFTGAPMRTSPLHYRVHSGSITTSTKVFDRKQRLMRRITEKHSDFFSEDTARCAIARFSPEAVVRHRISEFWWAKRYGKAAVFTLKTLFTNPKVFSPFAVLRRFRWTK